ncbi:MAG: hypothetical protein ABJO05_16505, partial [Roseibium sp.]
KTVYRALHDRGFFVSNVATADLTRPDLVSYIIRYQAHIAADRTGYLSRRQLEDLLADPEAPPLQEKQQIRSKRLLDAKAAADQDLWRADWQKLGYSLDQKKRIYRALHHLGLADTAEMVADFSWRLDLIKVVRAYQMQVGSNPTGFLTREQAETLLAVNAPLLPSERQAKLFATYGSLPVLGYFRDLGQQEYGISKPVSTVIKRFQGKFGSRVDGYVSTELFEAVKTIPLRVMRQQGAGHFLFADFEELPVSRDWKLWKDEAAHICEAFTASIHEDGFTGSASPSSVSLYRGHDWNYNEVATSIRLVNWKPDTIAEMRVSGRRYYVMSPRGSTRFVAKDGSRPDSPRKNYANLLNGMLRANGLEISYETVFGTRVVVSFSAMGLTKQLRALMKVC